MALSRYAGVFNANAFAYGIAGSGGPGPLVISNGFSAGSTSAQAVTLEWGQTSMSDGTILVPLNTNAPITAGSGTNGETVTPTAVGTSTPQGYNASTITAVFANGHGIGDIIASGTIGLQEAINYANLKGGGVVVVDMAWVANGGTTAMLAAAVLPSNGSVIIMDNRGYGIQWWANRGTGAVLAAPATPVAANAAVYATTGGTYANANYQVKYTYINAVGGETTASAALTIAGGATGTAILGGTGAVALTGAVGFRVYISAAAGSTGYLLPATAANAISGAAGLVQCGPITCFKIGGGGWQSATPLTSALAISPTMNSAFGTVLAQPNVAPPQIFQTTFQSFGNVGSVTSSPVTAGLVTLPTGFLNYVGRTLRIKGNLVMTSSSNTGTITVAINLHSVYGHTSTVIFTAVTASFAAASAIITLNFESDWTVATSGAAGTIEAHGFMIYNEAAAAAGFVATDFINGASGACDLTAQNTIEVTVANATIQSTAGNLYQFIVEVLN